MREYTFWLIAGSQLLYGEECLREVEANCRKMADGINAKGTLPWKMEYKGTVTTAEYATALVKQANADDSCAGIITYCHTFSPSKMWINALNLLQKPYLHLHTQTYNTIPNERVDMDYMNLHQAAHGDREHGFIGARMQVPRKLVVGYWDSEYVADKIGKWMRVAVASLFSREMKVMRFGDNMREVAVTEGDKVEAQIKFGWQVNTWPVGDLVAVMNAVSEGDVDAKVDEYTEKYVLATDDLEAVRYQAREEIAIKQMLDAEGCCAFANTFQDLHGMKQLPGIATQNLMAQGYGYGAEGDWKTAAMVAISKTMSKGMPGGTTFMEDYLYDFESGVILGAHMLEVCPTVANEKAKIAVMPLGIGDREPPARLIFEGKPGTATVTSLVDMGGRMRMIVQDIECVKPIYELPNLPVARVMWKPMPSLNVGAECWLLAGGAHHTVLSYDCDAEMMQDWARIMGIETVHIGRSTEPGALEQQLMMMDLVWKLK